jgi:hypothetical protein
MSIIELLEKVGPENIRVQYVDQCFESAEYSKKKGGVSMKILTKEVSVDDLLAGSFKKCGMIIWFDRDLYPKPEPEKAPDDR